MVQYAERLDTAFAALADRTRRGILERVRGGDASISDLAAAFAMTLTGIQKHVGLLEAAGLLATEKVGRVRVCRPGPRHLDDELAWLERHRQIVTARLDRLEQHLAKRRRERQER